MRSRWVYAEGEVFGVFVYYVFGMMVKGSDYYVFGFV